MSKTINKFWSVFEVEVFDIIKLSLSFLADEKELPKNEDGINRILYFNLQKANFELTKKDEQRIDLIPIYEAPNQPNYNDKTREERKREKKIPDFQFQKTDLCDNNPKNSAKQFAVECKRLGRPSSKNWILNENYVLNGINRFILKEWCYGKGKSGAMIGYIQNKEFQNIFDEINKCLIENNISKLINKNFIENKITELSNTLYRNGKPQIFNLHHFWIDLRKIYEK